MLVLLLYLRSHWSFMSCQGKKRKDGAKIHTTTTTTTTATTTLLSSSVVSGFILLLLQTAESPLLQPTLKGGEGWNLSQTT